MSISTTDCRTNSTVISGNSLNLALPLVAPQTEACLALLQQALADRQIRAIDLTLGYQWLMRLYRRQGGANMTMLTAISPPLAGDSLSSDQPLPACSLLLLAGVSASMALARGQICVDLSQAPLPRWQSWWPKKDHWCSLSDPYHKPLLAVVDAGQLIETSRLGSVQGVIAKQSETVAASHHSATYHSATHHSATPGLNNCSGPQFYIARYFVYEQNLAQHLIALSQHEVPNEPLFWQALNRILEQLFCPQSDSESQPDWQQVAAATACTNHLSVITGGPGTGKTTTVTKILLALCSLVQSSALRIGQPSEPRLRIALVASTGKAAARLMESVQASLKDLRQQLEHQSDPASDPKQSSGTEWPWQHVPQEATTIHRLLGMRHGRFIYNADRPLPYDCLVIDEASMIDLPLMERLLQAVAPGCRVIMLGDQDQLASVEAGSVLADITQQRMLASDRYKDQQSTFIDAIRTGQLQSSSLGPASLQRGLAHLYRSHRFDDNSGIGQLAAKVNQGESQQAWELFQHYQDIRCFEPEGDQPKQLSAAWLPQALAGYQGYWQAVQKLSQVPVALLSEDENQPAIKELFQQFARYQILTAVRDGHNGMHQINSVLEQALQQSQPSSAKMRSFQLDAAARGSSNWYAGRPIMISRNHHRLGLFNGDIGITIGQNDQYRVAFVDESGAIRLVLPSRLPEHETAFAFTVHKSQGSEFEVAHCILGNYWQPVMTRELIYTAVTRAKRAFWLTSSAMAWQPAVSTKVNRASGLSQLLCDAAHQK